MAPVLVRGLPFPARLVHEGNVAVTPPVQTQLTEEAKRLLELAERATPGPWVVHGDGDGTEWVVQEEGPIITECLEVGDVRFIAACRDLAPALADACLAQREALTDAADTFADFARGLRLLGHTIMAEAAEIAEFHTRLAAVSVGSPETRETK